MKPGLSCVKKLAFLVVIAMSFPVTRASATGSLREVQPLTFGHIAISGASPQHVVIATNGTETAPDGGVALLYPRGTYGVFDLEGYTPNVAIYLTIVDDTLDPSVVGTSFDVTGFNTLPSCPDLTTTCTIGMDGKLEVKIGATLITRNGTYNPGPYRGDYTLVVNF